MKYIVLSLLGLSVFYSHVASEPRPVKFLLLKGGRASYEVETAEDNDEQLIEEFLQTKRQTNDLEYSNEDFSNSHNILAKASDSNARNFFKRFKRLKNIFGNKNQPIIIRIFLNGTNVPIIPTNPTGPTNPTIPIDPTIATIPTVSTLPTTVSTIPTNPNVLTPRSEVPVNPNVPITTPTAPNTPREQNDNIEYTDDDKTSLDLPARVNYKRKVSKKNQSIIVRIPAKYRHLFDNGQQVKFSTKNDAKRKSVPNRRGHVNRKKLNSNKSLKNKNRLARIITGRN